MKTQHLLVGILTASIASAIATTPAPSTPTTTSTPSASSPGFRTGQVSLRANTPLARTDAASSRILDFGANIAVDQLNSAGTSAGVHKPVIQPTRGPIYSLFTEYNYIYTDDSRALGSDVVTHAFTLGGSALFNGNTFLGVNYSYSNGTNARNSAGVSSQSDAHFFSLVAARSFWNFLSVGVSGAYGNTDINVNNTVAGTITPANMETWTVSPFISATYKTGALTTSLTAMYQYEYDNTSAPAGVKIVDDTTKFSLTLRSTYAVSEKLKVQASAKYNQILTGLAQAAGLREARAWATFGGRVSYNVSSMLELYAGYSYDAFNNYLETHTATAGLRYTF